MQSSGSRGESQGDHNYVSHRLRSTSSEDSSIEFANPRRRRGRIGRRRMGNTDHDYVGLRIVSEDDGDVDTEAEPAAELSENAQPEDNDGEEEPDGDDNVGASEGTVDELEEAEIDELAEAAVDELAEAAQEMIDATATQEQNLDDGEIENAADADPQPPNPVLDPLLDSAPGTSAVTNGADVAATTNNNAQLVDLVSPSPPKKRKRLNLGTPKSNTPLVKPKSDSDAEAGEEDDGMTCPICLDSWEMSGEHRLVSLRCGHLFGDACIRRWLVESSRQTGVKACPQCKTKATNRDIRCLYAKRLRAIDRTEEHRLREQLDEERQRTQTLQTEVAALKLERKIVIIKMENLEAENERMKQLLRTGGGGKSYSYEANIGDAQQLFRLQMQRLYLERTIELTREPGCRVLIHAEQHSAILASQKSAQGLFPGYGVRFIDIPTFRTSTFLHASSKLLRDMSLNCDQQLLAVASMETRSKLFDLRTRQVASVFEPGEKTLWSCAMDRKEREHVLYLGGSNGSTYAYDMRFPDNILEEYKTEGDLSTVINVASVSSSSIFPYGGFLVCKLQSLWFYEYADSSTTVTLPIRLNIDGPFSSMQFDAVHETLLLSARCSVRYPQSRYIVGRLEKVDEMTILNVKVTFHGSKATPVMTRCTQIAVEANTLVAGYIQDVKQLALFDVRRSQRVQTMPVQEVIYDICPVHVSNATYLAGLSETKCRMYKLTSTNV